jgi:hypothetical protein
MQQAAAYSSASAAYQQQQSLPAAAATRAALADTLPADGMGMKVVPVRQQAEAAARGSTPFGGLFLALSSFVVASGLLLEWLLFSLLVAARRRDIGILAAIGWPAARVAGLLVLVAGLAAVSGVAVGSLLGPLWARLLRGSFCWPADTLRTRGSWAGSSPPS